MITLLCALFRLHNILLAGGVFFPSHQPPGANINITVMNVRARVRVCTRRYLRSMLLYVVHAQFDAHPPTAIGLRTATLECRIIVARGERR